MRKRESKCRRVGKFDSLSSLGSKSNARKRLTEATHGSNARKQRASPSNARKQHPAANQQPEQRTEATQRTRATRESNPPKQHGSPSNAQKQRAGPSNVQTQRTDDPFNRCLKREMHEQNTQMDRPLA